MTSKTTSLAVLALFIAITFAAAFVGSRFSPGEWYAGLSKPSWNPPNWIFGPVWTTLYLAMAVAAWLVWKSGSRHTRSALALFVIQLALNAAWSWIFFGLKQPGSAFAEILVLWSGIATTMVLFWLARPLAGVLFVPYLAWVSFAAFLNYTIWRLNS